jgi:hypothetical protein
MPELWQSLNIGPSFRLPRDKLPTDRNDLGALDAEQGGVVCEHYVSLVKGWFGRAKEQPLLSLYFWFDMRDEWSELHKNHSILLISEIPVANAQRFRYLDVGADRAMYLQNFLTDSSSVKQKFEPSRISCYPHTQSERCGPWNYHYLTVDT